MYLLAILQLIALSTGNAAMPATTRGTMSIHVDSIDRKFSCAVGVECSNIENGTLYFDEQHAQDRYVLIDYTEASRPNNPNGQCGAGEESYLRWFHIQGSKIVSSQWVGYESCLVEVHGGPVNCLAQAYSVEFDAEHYNRDTRHSTVVHSKATFDPTRPQDGLDVTRQPAKIVE